MRLLGNFLARSRVPGPVAPNDLLLETENLCLARGNRTVLDGISIQIRAGEVLALVGPNGAGKSTLLAALAGDLEPSAGGVRLAGKPLTWWSPVEQAMRRAVLPQAVSLSFPFTCAEVIGMGRSPWQSTRRIDQDAEAITQAVELCGVAEFLPRSFNSLSGGERARVCLAKVLAQRADLLLLDEPTAALDIRHQEMVLGIARAQAAAGKGVVVVLHDLELAGAYADQVAVLHDSRLVAKGQPAEVLTGPLLSSVYQHQVEVLPHPRTGAPMVIPVR